MGVMKQFIDEKIKNLRLINLEEEMFTAQGDYKLIKISASPVTRGEVAKMFQQGHGLRIIVGMGELKDFMTVWVGDSDANTDEGALHDTIANQFGIKGAYVPLEKSTSGHLRVTTTAKSFFDDPREIEDALDRNKEFHKIFGDEKIDYSTIGGGW